MINALIQNGDQTAVLKLPSEPFSLLYDLSQIGIRSRLKDIPINDDEDRGIQVKLFADSDIGNSLAVLFKPSHSLEDANLCAHMVENARPEILEELEQHIIHGQYFSPQAVMEDIKAMTEELISVTVNYGYDDTIDYHDGTPLYFQTAWSAPHPVLEKLTEMFPEIELEHEWADEDISPLAARRSSLRK